MMIKQDIGLLLMQLKYRLMLLFLEMDMVDLMAHGMQFGIVKYNLMIKDGL